MKKILIRVCAFIAGIDKNLYFIAMLFIAMYLIYIKPDLYIKVLFVFVFLVLTVIRMLVFLSVIPVNTKGFISSRWTTEYPNRQDKEARAKIEAANRLAESINEKL